MHWLITHISVAAFLLHMILGCCAHHAHAAETVCAAAEIHGHHHACAHDACSHGQHSHVAEVAAEPSPESTPHAPHHDCDGEECVFVAVGKTMVVHSDSSSLLPLLFLTPSALSASGPAWDAVSDWGERVALPVRAHLWNQVLLI